MRVASGLSLSIALVFASTALGARSGDLSRTLAGGGIACAYLAYLSIYAAFQLSTLISLTGASAAMSAIPILAFALANRDDDAGVATLGAAGGLATPFLLYTDGSHGTGLVVYTGLVVAAASAVFLSRGWRLLLTTTSLGAWAILGSLATQLHFGQAAPAEAASVQGGILFVAFATFFWGGRGDARVEGDRRSGALASIPPRTRRHGQHRPSLRRSGLGPADP